MRCFKSFLKSLSGSLRYDTVMNNDEHKNNPMHGVKLVQVLEELEAHYGWETLDSLIKINCFNNNPSIKSCLKFLRKTPWARTKVEALYLLMLKAKD
jgi:uncharacterized protein (DUF2132 family)